MSKLVVQGLVFPLTHGQLILLRPVGEGLGSPDNKGTILLGCLVQCYLGKRHSGATASYSFIIYLI